jgi:regulator of sigma E protease
MLPLGGFVDMVGERTDEERKGLPNELPSKKPHQRAIIFASGAIMNAITAFLFFILAFGIGVSFIEPVVGSVERGSPAWLKGIRTGDRIIAVNGEQKDDYTEVAMAVALMDEGKDLTLTVERQENGAVRTFDLTVTPVRDPRGNGMSIGVGVSALPIVAKVTPDSPAAKAGLKKGDKIVALSYADPESGEEVTSKVETFSDILNTVSQGKLIGRKLTVYTERRIMVPAGSAKTERLVLTATPEVHPESKGVFKIGVGQFQPLVVKAIRENTKASESLRVGDIITEIGGNPIYSPADLPRFLSGKGRTTFTLERTGKLYVTEADIESLSSMLDDVAFELPQTVARVGFVMPGMPAEKAGLRPGDTIIEVAGREVSTFTEFSRIVRASCGRPFPIVWERAEEGAAPQRFSATVAPEEERGAYLGIEPEQPRFTKRCGLLESCILGTKRTVLWAQRVFLVLRGLFTRTVSVENLAGPVGIFTISYAVTQYGIGTLIYFLGLISINLAILNIFPIPVLDGGHLLFLIIEKIKGSPVTLRTQIAAQTIGLILLMLLVVFVTYNDILRLSVQP